VNVIGKLSSCVPETFLEVSRVYNLITGKLSSCVPKNNLNTRNIMWGKVKNKKGKIGIVYILEGWEEIFSKPINQACKGITIA
jgi:long-subunit acyl-CoA synthetase (AMP-forming)